MYEIQDLYYLSAFNRSGGHHKREAFLLDNFEGEDLFIQVCGYLPSLAVVWAEILPCLLKDEVFFVLWGDLW
mgnify:FL=1